jgi:hypothetical protein
MRANWAKAKSREDLWRMYKQKFPSRSRGTMRRIIARLKKYNDIPPNMCASNGGVPASKPSGQSRNGNKITGIRRLSVAVDEIKKDYDDAGRIREGLEQLGTNLIKENDFRVALAIPFDRWRLVADSAEFKNNRQELKGRRFRGFYWGKEEVVAELKKAIDIL